uniref:Globin domain-containing protein n=1 Tax=Lotharella globosa TaxID=91324 RepID=A0A7S3Z6G4_9EUKA|mmetsp:Transcript_12349/g.25139  ORF Transcript_12349/g.25139 Transcript_12349/m.25139 type:complete len:198 (-) Transcript_12349:210-803(-)
MTDLTSKEKKLVTETWAAVMQDKSKHAITLFENIFDIAPAARALFKFGTVSDLTTSKLAKLHAEGVMDTVDFAIQRLDNLGEVVPALQKLGTMHANYSVVPAHFPIVGQALLKTLEDGLGEHWTPEVKAGWVKVWTTVVAVMKPELEKAIAEIEAGSGKEKGGKSVENTFSASSLKTMAVSVAVALAGFAIYVSQGV